MEILTCLVKPPQWGGEVSRPFIINAGLKRSADTKTRRSWRCEKSCIFHEVQPGHSWRVPEVALELVEHGGEPRHGRGNNLHSQYYKLPRIKFNPAWRATATSIVNKDDERPKSRLQTLVKLSFVLSRHWLVTDFICNVNKKTPGLQLEFKPRLRSSVSLLFRFFLLEKKKNRLPRLEFNVEIMISNGSCFLTAFLFFFFSF